MVLRVSTPPAVLQLVQPEKSALADMAKACCGGKFNDTSNAFCGMM